MKPDWDKLMAEFKDHASVLVGDADCTAGGKELCNEMGVRGYPSIKHGDPADLQDYEGGRDFASLKKFAGESLGPKCSPANIDLCDADKKKQIDDFMALSDADLAAKVSEKDAEQKKADEDLEALLKSLQNQYEEGQKKAEATKLAIKESGLGLMKSVQAHQKKAKTDL